MYTNCIPTHPSAGLFIYFISKLTLWNITVASLESIQCYLTFMLERLEKLLQLRRSFLLHIEVTSGPVKRESDGHPRNATKHHEDSKEIQFD